MTLLGADCSHFDAPDWRRAVLEGFRFLTHKAGGDLDDTEIGTWWGYMRPYGLAERPDGVLLGSYWVLYPGWPASRADAFLNRLDSRCPGWRDGPFILQADCEIWNGNTATRPSRADIKTFCDRLKAQVPKLTPIVYAPKWAYGDTLTGLGYPLWASRYVTGSGPAAQLYPGDTSAYWSPYSGQTPAILQYTSSATIGGQTTCDADAYRGTLAELTALLAPGWESDMPLSNADADLVTSRLLGQLLGSSGPTVAVALQSGYNTAVLTLNALKAFIAAEAQRDAAEAATLAAMNTVVQHLAASTGTLSDQQVQDLITQVQQAASDAAGTAATNAAAKLETELQALRHHLGDDQATAARPETLAEVDDRTQQQRQQKQAWFGNGS